MACVTKTTYCRICEALCGLEVDVEDGVVVETRPDPKHPVSRGFACVKGIRFGDVHRDPDRVRHPIRRRGNEWQRATWDDATSEIGAKLRRIVKEHGPHAVGLYFGNPSAFGYQAPLAMQGFVRGLGTRNVFSAGSQDCNDKFVVSSAMFGSSLFQPVPDFGAMRFLLLLGTNPAVSQMSFVHAPRPMEKLRGIVDRGGRVVVLDPRRTETAAHDFVEHHFIRPNTDVFLLAAITRRIVDRGLVDRSVVEAHTRGYEDLSRVLAQVDVARCALLSGIGVETIEDLATALGGRGAAIHLSTGVNQGTAGAIAYYLAQAIHVLTGNLDREGGLLFPRHLMNLPKLGAAGGLDRTTRRSRIGDFAPVMGTLPATILPDEITTPGEGRIRALIVLAGNPLLSCANSTRMRQALAQLDLLVSLDLYRNETGELGHYVLPTLDFFQREDFPLAFLTMQPEPYLQWTDAVADPVAEERDEWSIFVDLCAASGIPFMRVPMLANAFRQSRRLGKLDPFSPRRTIEMMLRANGHDLAALRKNPHGVLREPTAPGSFLGHRVLKKDGKVDLAPPALLGGLASLDRRAEAAAALAGRKDVLLLFTKREKTSHNSWMHNVPDLVRGRRQTNYVYLNPADAKARGIADGASVRVSNVWGAIALPVRLDDDIMPGTVAVPHGWGHAEAPGLRVASSTLGANVNCLAPDGPEHTDRIAGMTQLTGIPVTVELASPAVARLELPPDTTPAQA